MKLKQRFLSELITALSLMMDLDENGKLYHAWRVALLAERLARQLIPEYRTEIFYAGLLHDIGAISLPGHVANYIHPEDPLRHPMLLKHPHRSARIIKEIGPLALSADMVTDHHEHWDGRGYPRGIEGDKIHLGGQILRICDSFDILDRTTPNLDLKAANTALEKRRGSEFSDLMYELMISTLEQGNFFNEIIDEDNVPEMVFALNRQLPVMDISQCASDLQSAVRVFAQVIDAKHSYTGGHSERVAEYTYLIARSLGLSETEATSYKIAGYLHDAGKVAVPRSILDKKGPLDEEEWKLMKRHPVNTMEIMGMVTELQGLVVIAGGHHERYDGRGYPDGSMGESIPLGARIMAIADAYDAMTSKRPYQRNRSGSDARDVLAENSGTQFDPAITKVAIGILP